MIGKSQATKNRNLKHFKVGLVFMAADPFHYGHLRLIKRAKDICKKVYAITESDKIIRESKKREPFTTQKQRIDDLKGIRYLDGVYCRTARKDRKYWVNLLKADCLILGSDWQGRKWAGAKLGIKIVYFKRTPKISSTYLRKQKCTNI